MGAALIGGTHRWLFDIGGFTALACACSTLLEGVEKEVLPIARGQLKALREYVGF